MSVSSSINDYNIIYSESNSKHKLDFIIEYLKKNNIENSQFLKFLKLLLKK